MSTGIKVLAPATIDGLTGIPGGVAAAIDLYLDEMVVVKSNEKTIKSEFSKSITDEHKALVEESVLQFVAFIQSEGVSTNDFYWVLRLIKKVPDGVGLGSRVATVVLTLTALNEVLLHSFEPRQLIPLSFSILEKCGVDYNPSRLAACFGGGAMLYFAGKSLRISIPKGFSILISFGDSEISDFTHASQESLLAWMHGMMLSDFEVLRESMRGGLNDSTDFSKITLSNGSLGVGHSGKLSFAIFHNSLMMESAIEEISKVGLRGKFLSSQFDMNGAVRI